MRERFGRFLEDIIYQSETLSEPRGIYWTIVDPETKGCLHEMGCLFLLPLVSIKVIKDSIDIKLRELQTKK